MEIILPTTGLIEIESNEGQWDLLQKGLINEMEASAVLSVTDERRIKVTILIIEAVFVKGPDNEKFSLINSTDSKIEACIFSNFNFAINKTMKDYWLFRAFIKGATPVSILIQYFPVIKASVYTKVTNKEVPSMNFPTHMSN